MQFIRTFSCEDEQLSEPSQLDAEIAASVSAPAPVEENAGAAGAFELGQLEFPMELAEAAETAESTGTATLDLGATTNGPVPQVHEPVESSREQLLLQEIMAELGNAPFPV